MRREIGSTEEGLVDRLAFRRILLYNFSTYIEKLISWSQVCTAYFEKGRYVCIFV